MSLDSPVYLALIGLLCGVVGFRVGWRHGSRLGLPLTQALAGFVAFSVAWRGAGAVAGATAVLAWALGGTLVALPAFRRDAARTDRTVWRAEVYRAEMLDWLRGGRGFEARAGRTVLAHLRELAVYLIAAAISANFLSILMGAALLNYMNAWVASLLRVARRPWTVRVLGWNLWSIARVAAYVMLGSAAAAPLAAAAGYPDPGGSRVLGIAGGAGVLLDVVLKLALSRACGARLAAAVDLQRVEDEP